MKFRITRYYDGFLAEYLGNDNKWHTCGNPAGYPSVDKAREACVRHKRSIDSMIIEEFEL